MWKKLNNDTFILNLPNTDLYLSHNPDINQWHLRIESNFLPDENQNIVLTAIGEQHAKAMAILALNQKLIEKQQEIQNEIDATIITSENS